MEYKDLQPARCCVDKKSAVVLYRALFINIAKMVWLF
jgi:hypothetical protein